MVKRWTVGQSHFRLDGRVPRVRPGAYPERTLVMTKIITFPDTHLDVDLKTILHSDRQMKTGKAYRGVLCRDAEGEALPGRYPHYTFIEAVAPTLAKRNPHVFRGKYITVTLNRDGSLRPNFRPMPQDACFSPYGYALGVFNELMRALDSLVGK